MKRMVEHQDEIRSVKIRHTWRGRIADVIVFLWPIMPLRVRHWAFMNDDA